MQQEALSQVLGVFWFSRLLSQAVAALFADDAVLSIASEDQTRSRYSPPALAGALGDWFEHVDYTEVEHIDVVVEKTTAAVVSNWSGTYSGGADPTPFVVPTVTVFEFDDGLISGCDTYFVYDQVVNSTPTPTTLELPEVVNRNIDALLAGDAEALAALYADDGVLTGVQENHGRSWLEKPGVIQRMMNAWFCYVDHTDIETRNVIAEGGTIVVVSRWIGMSGTHARGCADKTPFDTVTITVFELEDGLIAHSDVYFEYDEVAN